MLLPKKVGFLGAYSFPILIVLSYYLDGFFWPFLPAAYAYVFVPIFDEIVGKDAQNATKEEFDKLINEKYFDFLVYSHVWIQLILLFFITFQFSQNVFSYAQLFGFILSQGIYASSIINVAHELGHRKSSIAQFHAKLALMSVCYSHFTIEHNRGHHVNVATPLDPATSKRNQSVFQFWKQTLLGSFRSAWHIESSRLIKKNLKIWSFKNEIIQGILGSLIFCSVLIFFFQKLHVNNHLLLIPIFFFGQSIVAIFSLECVNYIEHYGILRREITPGKFEKVNPLHSWNANHFYSNLMLFHLQRHSDHHAYAARPYQVLRHFDESPQLPFGYPVMILMSLVPPIWFKIMNARLDAWEARAYDTITIKNVIQQFA